MSLVLAGVAVSMFVAALIMTTIAMPGAIPVTIIAFLAAIAALVINPMEPE